MELIQLAGMREEPFDFYEETEYVWYGRTVQVRTGGVNESVPPP